MKRGQAFCLRVRARKRRGERGRKKEDVKRRDGQKEGRAVRCDKSWLSQTLGGLRRRGNERQQERAQIDGARGAT